VEAATSHRASLRDRREGAVKIAGSGIKIV
jgi:hypothetical protein